MMNNTMRALNESLKVPNLEALGAALYSVAGNLQQTADVMEGRLARFLGEPHSPNQPPQTVAVAEPQPGTLGSLQLAQERLQEQSERLARLSNKLADIF